MEMYELHSLNKKKQITDGKKCRKNGKNVAPAPAAESER